MVDQIAMSNEPFTQLDRIEAKLNVLLAALADEREDDPAPIVTLDGKLVGQERDQCQPL
jgi:hypothetical protein